MPAQIRILIDSASSGSGLTQAEKDLRGLDKAARSSGDGFTVLKGLAVSAISAVASAALEAGRAVAGFVGDSIKAAGDFEGGMNQFAAAAGNMGQAELDEFRQLFLDLGKELPVSTQEVQDAATTLVRGGLDPAVVSAGALRDSLQFAAAAGMDLAAAAELSIKQLATFGDTNATAAEQTAFLADAQNLLVKAANASTVDVAKLGDAMLAAGGQARAAGLTYEDFVTTMGAISGGFGSAAEAGTSFKNLLVRLQPSTQAAKDAMAELGLVTAEGQSVFYDAQGNFVGMQQAADLLQDAFTGLTDQQRIQAMQTIFGNDAMAAADILARQGGEGIAEFAAQMANANGVAGQATATQQGFNFAMTNLMGSIEALQITIGSKLLPILTPLIGQFTEGVNVVIGFAEAMFASGNPIAYITAQFPVLSAVLTAAQTAFQGLTGFILTIMPTVQGIITTTLAIIQAVWAQWGDELTTATQGAWQAIQGVFQVVLGVIQGIFNIALGLITGDWDTAMEGIRAANETIWNGISTFFTGILNIIAAGFGTSLEGIKATWDSNFRAFKGIADILMGQAQAGIQVALDAISGAFSGIKGTIDGVVGMVNSLIDAILSIPIPQWPDAPPWLGGGGGSGGAAMGGPIGGPTLVGEHGPELFVPASAGGIVPATATAGVMNRTTNNYFNQTVNTNAQASTVASDFMLLRALAGVS